MKRVNLWGIFLLSLFSVGFTSCDDDNDSEQPLKLESYQVDVNYGETKYIAITSWEGNKSKVTAISEDEGLVFAEIVDSKEDGAKEGLLYLRILGIGDGECSVLVKDEKENTATIKIKATDELADFKADVTTRLLLNYKTYKINLKEGDFNGGKYTFGREGNIVTFKWINEKNGNSATLVFTETSDKTTFSWDVHTDAVLTLINPGAEKVADREVVIKLPYLKVIGTQEKPIGPAIDGVYYYITDKAWIIFRLPAEEGQEKGNLGFCVGTVTNNSLTNSTFQAPVFSSAPVAF